MKQEEILHRFFGLSDFHRVIVNGGNTESLNTCIKGILKEKDHVITTYAEHNSVLRPLYELEEKWNNHINDMCSLFRGY